MLERLLSRHVELAYTLLRIIAGFMFLFHGAQKLLGVLTDKPQPPMFSQMWIGGIVELTCGTLVAMGLFTRLAAFLASGQMAVAYFQFHWKLQLDEQFFPIVNRGELALMYCFTFLFIACRGPGRVSIDAMRGKR